MKQTKWILVLVLLLCLGGCNILPGKEKVIEQKRGDIGVKQGGTLTVPLTNFDTLNPLLTHNRSYYQLCNLFYDRLFVYESSGRMVPSLVEHVEITDAGKRIGLTIKDKIYWQDGTPITTKDIAKTFEAIKNAPDDSVYKRIMYRSMGRSAGSDLSEVAKAVVFDERNIDIEFDRPYGNFMEILSFPILPAHKYTEEGMLEKDDFKVLGSGPFILKKWEKNKRIFLEKNQNYHGSLPYIDEVLGLIFSDNQAIRQAYDAGQIDLCVIDDYTWDRYRTDEHSTVESYETQKLELISYNTSDPIMQDASLRRAVDLAINKERIVDSLYLSQGSIANFFINPKLSGGLFTREESYASIDTAISLLEKAGYKDLNGDGMRENKQGGPLRLVITANLDNHRMKTEAQMIIEDLKKIGIKATLRTDELQIQENGEPLKEMGSSGEDIFNRHVTSGDFQMAVIGMDFSAIVDLRAPLSSTSVGGMNLSRYGNNIIDTLLDDLAKANEEKERKAYIDEIYAIFRKEVPYTPIVFKQNVLVTNKKIQGLMRPNAFNIFYGIGDIYISDEIPKADNHKKRP